MDWTIIDITAKTSSIGLRIRMLIVAAFYSMGDALAPLLGGDE
jgi:hypothetical protein